MTSVEDFRTQAIEMRNQLVVIATEEIDQWLNDTLAMLERRANTASVPSINEGGGQRSSVEARQGSNGKSLALAARTVIETIEAKTFNTLNVRGLVEQHVGPLTTPTQKANLANLLRRMVERGEIEIVRKAKGRKPTTYKRVIHRSSEQTEEQNYISANE